MSHDQLRVACLQQRISSSNHLEALIEPIKKAAQQGAELVLLPELHNTPYFCQIENPDYFDWAEPLNGPTCERLGQLAQSLNIVIVGSIFERRAAGVYHNTAIVLERDGSLCGHYRKMHIPNDPGYHEKFYFTPGDLGFQPIQTSVGKLGVLICWDQWFPEAARLMALAGADILLYPTAIGWDPNDTEEEQARQHQAWQIIQRAQAIANGLPVLSCNRVSFEAHPHETNSGIPFWGGSFISGPQGELLAEADQENEAILLSTLDFQRTETVRRLWPYLRDRRIDAYSPLLKRFNDESNTN